MSPFSAPCDPRQNGAGRVQPPIGQAPAEPAWVLCAAPPAVPMKAGPAALMAGSAMVAAGLVLSVLGQPGSPAEDARHAGTFVGLLGIGAVIAGILLRLVGERWQYE